MVRRNKPQTIDAETMAGAAGIDAKTFRAALRTHSFLWHEHYDRWIVEYGSREHLEMMKVLHELCAKAN